jgi:hypothetical protein
VNAVCPVCVKPMVLAAAVHVMWRGAALCADCAAMAEQLRPALEKRAAALDGQP